MSNGQAAKMGQPSTSRKIDQNVQSWKSSTPHQISIIFFRVITEVDEPGSDIRELGGLHIVYSGVSPDRIIQQIKGYTPALHSWYYARRHRVRVS